MKKLLKKLATATPAKKIDLLVEYVVDRTLDEVNIWGYSQGCMGAAAPHMEALKLAGIEFDSETVEHYALIELGEYDGALEIFV